MRKGKFRPKFPTGIILTYGTSYATLWDRHEITINHKFDLGWVAALEGGGLEGEAAVGVGAVGPVEVLGVEVVEEERGAAPDPGDGVQPPPRQAQHPVPEALGPGLAAAHEDVPRRQRRGVFRGGRRRLRPRALARRRGGGVRRHGRGAGESGLGLCSCADFFFGGVRRGSRSGVGLV